VLHLERRRLRLLHLVHLLLLHLLWRWRRQKRCCSSRLGRWLCVDALIRLAPVPPHQQHDNQEHECRKDGDAADDAADDGADGRRAACWRGRRRR
jgi:hypothetical protein